MAGSTLHPDNLTPGRDISNPPGHDLRSLGPSDSSDSGSDMAGPGLLDDDLINLDRGTNEDSDAGLGDLDLDDNSDRYGTGEHLTAGKDPRIRLNSDIDVDRVVSAADAGLGMGLDQAEEARLGITDEELEQPEESDESDESDSRR